MDVVVLGCGYLGTELGRGLRADGHDVVGVRRSEEGLAAVERAGLDPVRADVTDRDSLATVPDADWVVYAASAGGRGTVAARETYVDGLRTAVETFADRADPPDRILYTSSTGVYGDRDGAWVDEETPIDPETERERVLATAERIAIDEAADRGLGGTVARLGGIYGPDRYRVERYLDGPIAPGYLNLVHRDDAAGAVGFLLTEDHARGEVVTVVDDEPVDRQEFADWLADQCGVAAPRKRTREAVREDDDLSAGRRRRLLSDKRCSNAKLRALGYEFEYPTVREGYRQAVESYGEADHDGDPSGTDGGEETTAVEHETRADDAPRSDGGAELDVDLSPGDALTTAARTITEADLVNFSGVSGDHNYLHLDAERMADSEYGERIAHGALVFSIMTGLVWQAREEQDVVAFYGVDRLRFPAPVLVGDTIHAELEVVDVAPTDAPDAEALVRQEARVRNQDGDVVLSCEPLALVG